MVASNRQNRPHMPKNYCPFCPGSGKVPDDYRVYVYPNDFPTLQSPAQEPPTDIGLVDGLYEVANNHGKCEVILYSPDHHTSLYALPVDHIADLVRLWKERFVTISQDEGVKYIMIFENRGKEVGVTMPHPHGQLYAYPYLPQKPAIELANCKRYFEEKGRDMLGDMNAAELTYGKRMVMENEDFLAYIPFFTDYPYGVYIVAREPLPHLGAFSNQHIQSLASMLKAITSAFERLFDREFPYMMCLQQVPINLLEHKDAAQYYRFHVEFYPPLRSAKKIKWNASSETGAWAAANPRNVEETAAELRALIEG